ncbi:MAG: choice-of-anchor D domain-containing protein [Pseudomonadota bacterium]
MSARPTLLSLALLLGGCPDYRVHEIGDGPDGGGDRQLRVDPEVIDFGQVMAGEPVADRFTITSVGTATVALDELHIHGSGAFTLLGDPVEGDLAPGQAISVEVLYTPATPDDAAEVVVSSDATVPRIMVDLLGEGVMPDLVFDPPYLLLQSFDGETAYGSFIARNDGLADLVVDSWALQGERFTAESELPGTLAPGEETVVQVSWTPTAEMDDFGYFWASSNDLEGHEVATLEGLFQIPCLGLHEAYTRDLVRMTGDMGGITVRNRGDDLDVCIDRWYVFISDDTQDAGAGDPAYVEAHVYGEEGSIELAPSDSVTFAYGMQDVPAWWCVELTQMTDDATDFDFTGAQVPAMLLDTMLSGDWDPNSTVWQDLDENPVMIVGRTRGFIETVAGGTSYVEIQATNLGRQPTTAEVTETIPAGMSAGDFTLSPSSQSTAEDGSVTYTWQLAMDAAIDTDSDEQTIYDTACIGYTLGLTEEACLPRTQTPAPTVTWQDSGGQVQHAAGSPLIIACW